MSPHLTDEDLSQALAAAAASYPVPEALDLESEIRKEATVLPLHRRRGVQLWGLAAAAVAVVLVLVTISAGSPSLKNELNQSTSANSAPERTSGFDNGTGGVGETGGTTGGSTDSYAFKPEAGLVGGVAAPPVAGGVAGNAAPGETTRIVQTGTISLVVDDGKVGQAMGQLRAVATRNRGYISNEQSQGIGDNPTGTITMRIPVASFDAVVKEITGKGFGAKVISSESSGRDVTAEYADTAAQIATLKAARGRYLTILNAAKTVAEILSVQQRVDEVQGQIDRLEGSRRVLANQSDLATLTVSVNEKRAEVLSTERSGWSKAWHDAVDGFTSGIQSLIAHSGRTLLVLLVLAAALMVGRWAWHIARRRLI